MATNIKRRVKCCPVHGKLWKRPKKK